MNEYQNIDVQCCIRDEGRSLETGLQELVSNHHMLLWLRVKVVSDMGKGSALTESDNLKGDDCKGITDEVL